MHVVSDLIESHSPVFFSAGLWPQDALLISLFRKTKGFFYLSFNNRLQKVPPSFFAYLLTGKRSAYQRKKIQGCDFLLNRRPHAKIQLIWTKKKKNRPKFDTEWLCCGVFNYLSSLPLFSKISSPFSPRFFPSIFSVPSPFPPRFPPPFSQILSLNFLSSLPLFSQIPSPHSPRFPPPFLPDIFLSSSPRPSCLGSLLFSLTC